MSLPPSLRLALLLCLLLLGDVYVARACKVLLYSDASDGGAALQAALALNQHNGPNAALHEVVVRAHSPASTCCARSCRS